MKKWEYKVVKSEEPGFDKKIESKLIALGAVGWRLVPHLDVPGISGFIMEREVPEPPAEDEQIEPFI